MRLIALLLAPLLLLTACAAPQPERARALEGTRILVFTHTTGYRHESIPAAREALRQLIATEGGEAVLSEDPALFSAEGLARFRSIVLLSTTTDARDPASEWLTGERREAVQAFVRRGGGIIGIHAASDSHYHWPWYGEMIGGRFERHPPGTARGRLAVAGPRHPATERLPAAIQHIDEWYAIRDYRTGSRLLLALDPESIGEAGAAWPISWTREFQGGRIFYTALGHTEETYAQPFFLDHIRGALRWVTQR